MSGPSLVVRTLLARRRLLGGRRNSELAHRDAPSHVHVLRNAEELQTALRRSAQSERRFAETLTMRADRYEALIQPAHITNIRANLGIAIGCAPNDKDPANGQPGSA